MRKMRLFLLAIVTAALLLDVQAAGCTTFVLKQDRSLLFGRNFDFCSGVAFVTVNSRGVTKTAFGIDSDRPFSWTAAYGSVTFNQVAKYFPYDGMNEAGLVVAQMMNEQSRYSPPDARPGLTELQWIQYQLDTNRSVAEVLASDERVRILDHSVPLHFLVLDRSGDAAAIEWLGGKRVVHRGSDLVAAVLTNDPYLQDLAFSRPFIENGKTAEIPAGPSSEARFARAAAGVLKFKDEKNRPAYECAFTILGDVSNRGTRYSAVYDPLNLEVYFRSEKNPAIRKIMLKSFDFSCPASNIFADIHKAVASAKDFEPFTLETNRFYLEKLLAECEFLRAVLAGIKEQTIEYMASATCE